MIEIRKVTSEDFEDIWPMFCEVVRAGESYPYPMDTSKEQGRRFWFSPGAHVYVAYLDGQAAATRYIVANKPGLGGHVANTGVIIDQKFRGRGLGKKMMEFGLQEAKELGFKALQLNLVVEPNKASLAICQEYGFHVVGRLPKAFLYQGRELVDAFVLFREL